MSLVNLGVRVDGQKMCINIYDVREDDTYPDCGMNWPAPIHNVTRYLDVRLPTCAFSYRDINGTHSAQM